MKNVALACFNPPLDLDCEDIRQQLNDQLKCLDIRLETQASLVAEIQDYYRRRAEVEMEYSRALDKLSKGLVLRHKAEKQKREQWHLFSSYSCWQHLVATTRRQSRDHAVLSEIFANQLINRFNHIMEDVQHMYKRCREIGIESHEELLKVLHELHTSMKTYQTYHSEELHAEGKLRAIEAQRTKLEQTIPKEKLERAKKFKLILKEIDKRQTKFNDASIKALKARNDYLLCMDASNAAIHKYFVDDLSDLIDCMDFGFHTCLARTMMMHLSSEDCLRKSQQSHIDGMNKCITSLDSRVDKQKFLEFNNSAFMVPKKFEFLPHKEDEVAKVTAEKTIKEELEQRHKQLAKRLTALKTESEEVWKTLETAERSLLEMIMAKDYDCTALFDEDPLPGAGGSIMNKNGLKQPEALALKLRADRQETEDFYLNKFREYTLGSNLIARLNAKQRLMRKALGTEDQDDEDSKSQLSSTSSMIGGSSPQPATRPHSLPQKTRKKRIGRTPMLGQPKLFGGSLEEYLETTNQEIPLLILSCIRIINLYGLHHQGIFRVSGSQVEINNFRETFERGDDPLADVTDASDINSIAGVLKLYLRELREPLFPIYYFELLMEISQVESKQEFVLRVREVIANLPRSVVLVLRYLFAFLNHLSEFSDENMMDPYNLAICFGPTLLPIPEDKDQVQYQNLVNELIKNIIIYQEEIFPDNIGMTYEKYISTNIPDDNDVGESPPDQSTDQVDDSEADNNPSEDDAVFPEQDITMNLFGKADILEAVAQFDFKARSQRELSFRRGNLLTLYTQVSNDWWKGCFDGKEGLIPDKYILLKIKEDDRDKLSTDSSGAGELPGRQNERRRTSSSSDSLSGISPSPRLHSSSDFILEEVSSDPSVNGLDNASSILDASSVQSVIIDSLSEQKEVKLPESRIRRRSLSPSSLGRLKPLESPGWDARKLRPCLSADESAPNRKQSNLLEESIGDLLDESHGSCGSTGTSLSDLNLHDLSAYDPADEHSNQELAKDLDHTLAKVYTSINTIEKEKELEREMIRRQENLTEDVNSKKEGIRITKSHSRQTCKDTPDLVMDLPVSPSSPTSSISSGGGISESPPKYEPAIHIPVKRQSSEKTSVEVNKNKLKDSKETSSGSLSELTTAERFALSNQCTMKKGTMSRSGGRHEGHSETSPQLTAGQSLSDAQTQTFTSKNGEGPSIVNKGEDLFAKSPVTPISKSGDKPDIQFQGSVPGVKPQVKVKPPVMKKPTNYAPSPEMARRSQEREYKQTSC